MTRVRFFVVLALFAAGAILATRGTADPDVSLSSLTELWSDALRDADQVGMHSCAGSATGCHDLPDLQ